MITEAWLNPQQWAVPFSFSFFFSEHKRTPSGKKMVTGGQVVTVSQVQLSGVGGRPFRPVHNRRWCLCVAVTILLGTTIQLLPKAQ